MSFFNKKDKKSKQDEGSVLDAIITGADTSQTDMSKVVDKFINVDDDRKILERLTELNQSQIMGITVLLTTAEKYKIRFLQDFIHNYLSLMFSKNRKSRQEIIELFKSYSSGQFNPEQAEMMRQMRR